MGGAQRPLGCRSRKRVGDRCVSWCQKGSLGSKPLRGMEQVSMVPAHPKLEGRWLDPVGGRAWTKPHGSPSSRVAAPHISRRFQTGQSSAGAFQVAEVARGCDATGPGGLFQAQGTRPHEVSGRARPAARSGGEKRRGAAVALRGLPGPPAPAFRGALPLSGSSRGAARWYSPRGGKRRAVPQEGPRDGRPARLRTWEPPGSEEGGGQGAAIEISFLSWMGTLPRAGDGRDDAGARGRLGPRRQSCQRRKVSRVSGGGDVVLSGVRHTPRRIPGPRTEIKGRGRTKLLLKCPLPTPEAPGWGGSVAHVSWTPSLPYPVILTILAGVWDGAST